jgi:hypothetical protein
VLSARAVGLSMTGCTRRKRFAGALRTGMCALTLVLVLPTANAVAHKGNPHYRSNVRTVTPATPGIQVQILNFDDRLLLTNRSGKDVVVKGYEGEPYIRILGDGTVQQNRRSPALYLNQDRFAQVKLPPQADPKASPQWQSVDKTGRFEWHDHRIHWMSKSLPPEVKDKGARTKIFNWRVPISVGSKPVAIAGTLYWQPSSSSASIGAFVALGGFCVLALALVFIVRARRRRPVVREKAKAAW